MELPSTPPWRRLSSRAGPDLHIFRVRLDTLENPRSRRAMERVVLETPDWVHVIALTPNRELVLVRQHRFGLGAVTTEIPAGMVEPGETPLAAAQRELLEETGYAAEDWTDLGAVEPNPAFHDNLCHPFLARGARRVAEPRLDPGEDIRVALVDPESVRSAILTGEIRHSLVVTAFSRVLDLRRIEL